MIPMADNINHNMIDAQNQIINVSYQSQGETNPDYFQRFKFMNDYSQLIPKSDMNTIGRYDLQ